MGFYLSFEVAMTLRGKPVLVQVNDHYIQDGDLDEDGELQPDELVFNYRVFDPEEEAELTQITEEEHWEIYKAVLVDLASICED